MTMNDPKDIDPREALRRLGEFLDEEPPTDEEARAICAAMGADIPAIADRILATVAAYEAGLLAKDQAPRSHVGTRRARARDAMGATPKPPRVRRRVRR
jgi:hypothetical protein